MKRTTIFLEEQIERDLRAVARRQGRPVASVVREALAEYVVGVRRQNAPGPSFVGVGASGRHDVAERHETLLWADFDPHVGQSGQTPGSRRARAPRRSSAGRRRKAQRG